MAFGVTSTGFVKKTFNDIVDEMVEDARTNFGQDFDLRQSTLQYQIIASFARQFVSLWDTAESLYNTRFVNLAENVELDYAVKFIGIRRRQPSFATGEVQFTGTNGTVIPIDFLAETLNGIQFKTTETGTISGGTVTLDVQALLAGANGNVDPSTITTITNPLADVTAVTNSSATAGGQDRETDSELRRRYFDSLALGGGSTSDSIRAALLTLSGVVDVIVRENNTNTTDANGLPPHSVGPIVLGGTDNDILTALLRSKPAGIQAFGDVSQTFTDNSGNSVTVAFTRPTETDVYIRATVTSDSNYPTDGDTQVENVIIAQINALGIGEDVILYRISTAIGSQVAGITNLVLESSSDGVTYMQADVSIGDTEKATTDAAKVVVQ